MPWTLTGKRWSAASTVDHAGVPWPRRREGAAIHDLTVEVRSVRALSFEDGAPVRAASGIATLGEGWVVVQDDANHVAWWQGDRVVPARVFAPTDGLDTFSEAEGTKHLKPDLEAACEVPDAFVGTPAVVLLGSGSLPARMRGALLTAGPHRQSPPQVASAALDGLYPVVARALGIELAQVNLEGACVVGDALRWFQRGLERQGVPSGSVDVDLMALIDALRGARDPASVAVDRPRRLVLGAAAGRELAVTDVVPLASGHLVMAAAAEDTPDAVADGPVVAAAVVVVDLAGDVVGRAALPRAADGHVWKVEGLAARAVRRAGSGGEVDLLAVADQDDPAQPSPVLELRLHLPSGLVTAVR